MHKESFQLGIVDMEGTSGSSTSTSTSTNGSLLDRKIRVSVSGALVKLVSGFMDLINENVVYFVTGFVLGIILCRVYYWYRDNFKDHPNPPVLLENPDCDIDDETCDTLSHSNGHYLPISHCHCSCASLLPSTLIPPLVISPSFHRQLPENPDFIYENCSNTMGFGETKKGMKNKGDMK